MKALSLPLIACLILLFQVGHAQNVSYAHCFLEDVRVDTLQTGFEVKKKPTVYIETDHNSNVQKLKINLGHQAESLNDFEQIFDLSNLTPATETTAHLVIEPAGFRIHLPYLADQESYFIVVSVLDNTNAVVSQSTIYTIN